MSRIENRLRKIEEVLAMIDAANAVGREPRKILLRMLPARSADLRRLVESFLANRNELLTTIDHESRFCLMFSLVWIRELLRLRLKENGRMAVPLPLPDGLSDDFKKAFIDTCCQLTVFSQWLKSISVSSTGNADSSRLIIEAPV